MELFPRNKIEKAFIISRNAGVLVHFKLLCPAAGAAQPFQHGGVIVVHIQKTVKPAAVYLPVYRAFFVCLEMVLEKMP